MGKTYEGIDDSIRAWMARQHMFFVGSAPLSEHGHVNLSPKGARLAARTRRQNAGLPGLRRQAAPRRFAHVRGERPHRDNDVCVRRSAQDLPVSRQGGRSLRRSTTVLPSLRSCSTFPGVGTRAIIRVRVDRISDSCGYGVPNYDFKADRRSSQNAAASKGTEGIPRVPGREKPREYRRYPGNYRGRGAGLRRPAKDHQLVRNTTEKLRPGASRPEPCTR